MLQATYAFHWDTLRWAWGVLLDGHIIRQGEADTIGQAHEQVALVIEELGGDPNLLPDAPQVWVPGRN